jgi:hypothetical protein
MGTIEQTIWRVTMTRPTKFHFLQASKMLRNSYGHSLEVFEFIVVDPLLLVSIEKLRRRAMEMNQKLNPADLGETVLWYSADETEECFQVWFLG